MPCRSTKNWRCINKTMRFHVHLDPRTLPKVPADIELTNVVSRGAARGDCQNPPAGSAAHASSSAVSGGRLEGGIVARQDTKRGAPAAAAARRGERRRVAVSQKLGARAGTCSGRHVCSDAITTSATSSKVGRAAISRLPTRIENGALNPGF